MSKIVAQNLCLNYRTYVGNSRSLKHSFLNIATGGKLSKSAGYMVINALSNVNFEIGKGDRLGLIGHNGSGKSSLLKVLAQVYEPSSGLLEITGSVSSLLSIAVGMQSNATGYENIRLRCLMHNYDKVKTKKVIAELEEFTELGDFLSMPIKTYSTGMNLRLAFGLATTIEPDILLFDEVVGTGDMQFVEKAHERISKIIETSNVLVLASHSNELIRKFCNKILWLEHGAIKMFDTTETVLEIYEKHKQL